MLWLSRMNRYQPLNLQRRERRFAVSTQYTQLLRDRWNWGVGFLARGLNAQQAGCFQYGIVNWTKRKKKKNLKLRFCLARNIESRQKNIPHLRFIKSFFSLILTARCLAHPGLAPALWLLYHPPLYSRPFQNYSRLFLPWESLIYPFSLKDTFLMCS